MAYSIGFDIFAKDTASATFDKLGKNVGNTESKFSKFSGAAKVALAAVSVAVVKFGVDSVAAYTDAEAQQRVLTDAYERFPAMADVSVQSLRDQAQALQDVTKFDGDATAAMMGTLGQYKLNGKQIKELTPLVQDYAEKTGKSLPDAAETVGKALMGNTKGLKDVGINYKATGDKAEDYKNIQKLLNQQVGGFAEKEGKSAEGQAVILKNKFGDIEETVGGKLQPAMLKLTDAGLKTIDWMEKNQPVAIAIAGAIGVLTVATWAMNSALLANPIGLVTVALVLLGVGLVALYQKSETFRNIVDGAFRGIAATATWMWNTILQPVTVSIIKGYGLVFQAIGSVLTALGNIPGFEWAKTAGEKMSKAGDGAFKLADNIKKIPDHKDVKINIGVGLPRPGSPELKALLGPAASKYALVAPGNAGGTANWRGGLTWLAEDGPELVDLPAGSRVHNAGDTARALAGRGSSGSVGGGGSAAPVVINVNGALDPAAVARQIQTMLKALKRTGGADLGLA